MGLELPARRAIDDPAARTNILKIVIFKNYRKLFFLLPGIDADENLELNKDMNLGKVYSDFFISRETLL